MQRNYSGIYFLRKTILFVSKKNDNIQTVDLQGYKET